MSNLTRDLLIEHEGVRLKPYTDTVGKLTIGVGRNLDDVGISHQEAMLMLDNDISAAENDLLHQFPWYADLDTERQAAMINLRFNMGLKGLMTFKRFLAAMSLGLYHEAAGELLDSKWAKQVQPSRVASITTLIKGTP